MRYPWPALLAALAAASAGAQPIQTLVLSGANNHDWVTTTPALVDTLEASGRFEVSVTEDPSSLTPEALADYDLIVSNWTNWPDEGRTWGEAAENAVLDFVRSGKGYALFHAACAVFSGWPEYQELIGATWELDVTGHGSIHEFPVTITDGKHAITHGLGDSTITDELWHRVKLQPDARVLATAFSSTDQGGTGEQEPVALVTRFGEGRCFNLILGHDTNTMADENWRLLMLRGAEWAGTGEVTIEQTVDIDTVLAALASYRRHEPRENVERLDRAVQAVATDKPRRKALAETLAAYLRTDATDDAKAVVLRELGLIGGPLEVPDIEALLDHEALRFHAIAALERIPGKAARVALPKRDEEPTDDSLLAQGEYQEVLDGSPPEHVREAALVGLMKAEGATAEEVADHLASGDETRVRAASRYLREVGGGKTAAVVEELEQRPEDEAVAALAWVPSAKALEALADIGGEAAARAAVELTARLDAAGVVRAQGAMERLIAANDDAPELQQALKQALWDAGVPYGKAVSTVLADTGPNLALGATATSPDGLDSDGQASGDQAAIDGDPETYWDETDEQEGYRLRIDFPEPTEVSALRILGWAHHNYAPRSFEVICDGEVVLTVTDAWYEANVFGVTFQPTRCGTLELNITARYGRSPAIRELEVFGPENGGRQ